MKIRQKKKRGIWGTENVNEVETMYNNKYSLLKQYQKLKLLKQVLPAKCRRNGGDIDLNKRAFSQNCVSKCELLLQHYTIYFLQYSTLLYQPAFICFKLYL